MSYYAALDLGSNSFHLLIVKKNENGSIQEVDNVKHMVRLGEGLGEDNTLSEESIERALEALFEMEQRIRNIPPEQVRAVGTNTMRVAKNGEDFLKAAEKALGHEIEIINGTEEARLIYQGIIRHNSFSNDRNMVIDVGGGSTEVIIGDKGKHILLRSMKMGCANMGYRFFPKGEITKKSVKKALDFAAKTLEPHIKQILDCGWQRSIMSSGTAKAIEKVLIKLGWAEAKVSRENLDKLLELLIDIGNCEKFSEKLGIDPARSFGFTGGVCILAALSRELKITESFVSQAALREGVLLELMGKEANIEDECSLTVSDMQRRFNIDTEQAQRVAKMARKIEAVMPLRTPSRFATILDYAAALHEIGLSVARSKSQNHGAYIVENADMPGFSQLMQQMMSILIRGQRKKLPAKQIKDMKLDYQQFLWQSVMALRIAVLLYRSRNEIEEKYFPKADFKGDTLTLSFSRQYLDAHYLTLSDLEDEKQDWENSGVYKLVVREY